MVAMAAGANASKDDLAAARKLFEAAADVIELDETHIDTVTALSGSGPAYFFYLVENMIQAGVELGLTPEQRKQIAQTLAAQAEQHSALKLKCRDAIEDEFKAIAALLTPEQQEKAREEIESRMLRAAAASSIADRLEAGADPGPRL